MYADKFCDAGQVPIFRYFEAWYLSYEKNTVVDNLRVEPTIIFMENLSFSLKLFSGHFYGQSFIKTVRGSLVGL